MATKCVYCEVVCAKTVCVSGSMDQINSYGQKTTESVEPPMICSTICLRAENKRALRRNLEQHLVELSCISDGLGGGYPFIGVFVSNTILFYKSEITRKDYLESVLETIELVNALQNEGLLQIVCHQQAWTIRLEQLSKKYNVKFPW